MPIYRFSKQYYYLPSALSTIFLTSYLYLHSIFYLSLYLSRIYLCICLSHSVLDVKAWAKSKVSVSGGEGRIDKGGVKKYVFCLFLDAKDLSTTDLSACPHSSALLSAFTSRGSHHDQFTLEVRTIIVERTGCPIILARSSHINYNS